MKSYKNKGFTLIELMVAISIVGMLSSIVVASTGNARERARIARALMFESSIHHAYGSEIAAYLDFNDRAEPFSIQSDYKVNIKQLMPPGYNLSYSTIGDTPSGYGSSYKFNSGGGNKNSYIEWCHGSNCNSTNNEIIVSGITVSMWIRPDSTYNNELEQFLISGNTGTDLVFFSYISRLNISSDFNKICYGNEDSSNNCKSVKIPLGKWTLITFSGKKNSNNMEWSLYIDGVPADNGAVVSSQIIDDNGFNDICVADWYGGDYADPIFGGIPQLIGSIDNVGVYLHAIGE